MVAKYLVSEYLTTKADTPKSVLSASQLPFFSDEDFEEGVDDGDGPGVPNGPNSGTAASKKSRKSKKDKKMKPKGKKAGLKRKSASALDDTGRVTSAALRCEQRVTRWMAMNKLQEHLQSVDSWDFDVFYVVETAGNYAMPTIFLTLAQNRDLINELDLSPTALCNYFHQISMEYKSNPYHNVFHGCDVLVNCNYFLNAKLMRNVRALDQFACLVAGATHDVGHPGNNNGFEIAIESDLAVTYNDIAVLESYHIALAWQVLKRPGCNILSGLDLKQRREFRKLFIDSILNTDMTHHASQQKLLAELIDAVTNSGIDLDDLDDEETSLTPTHPSHHGASDHMEEDGNHGMQNVNGSQASHSKRRGSGAVMSRKSSIVSISNIPPNSIYADPVKFAKVVIPLMVHTADLSNPSKDFKLYSQWADRVVKEFFEQAANEEKNCLPVTAMMDPEKTDLPTIQTGFINFVIRPWFDLWGRLLKDRTQGPLYQQNVKENFRLMQIELQKIKNEKVDDDQDDNNSAKSNAVNSAADKPGDSNAATVATSTASGSGSGKGHKKKNRSFGGSATARNNGGSRLINDSKALALSDVGSAAMHGKERSISVVDMTFEDINKVAMMDNMHKLEQLKSQQKELHDAQSNLSHGTSVEREYVDREPSPQFTGSEMNGDMQYVEQQNEYGRQHVQPLQYEQEDDKDDDDDDGFSHSHHHIVSHHEHGQHHHGVHGGNVSSQRGHSHQGRTSQIGFTSYDMPHSSQSPPPHPPSHPPPAPSSSSHRVSIGNGGTLKKKRLLYSNPSNEYVQHSHSQSLHQHHNGLHQHQNMSGGGPGGHGRYGTSGIPGGGGRRNSFNGVNSLDPSQSLKGGLSASGNPRNSKKAKKASSKKRNRNRKHSSNLESVEENQNLTMSYHDAPPL